MKEKKAYQQITILHQIQMNRDCFSMWPLTLVFGILLGICERRSSASYPVFGKIHSAHFSQDINGQLAMKSSVSWPSGTWANLHSTTYGLAGSLHIDI